jgi:gas vesicle protein
MKTFFVGFGIGAALGVLFAPRSGDEIRGDVRRAVNDFMSNGRRSAHNSSDVQCSHIGGNHGKSGDHGLNTVSREQLMSVYGIGSVLADRIIANRPYAKSHDVVEQGIISENTFAQLRKDLLLGNKGD